jgi:hypothetical protein
MSEQSAPEGSRHQHSRPKRNSAAANNTVPISRMLRSITGSIHLRQLALLTPCRSAPLEQRSARVQQTKIMSGSDTLALVALHEYFDAMFATRRLTHEMTDPSRKA